MIARGALWNPAVFSHALSLSQPFSLLVDRCSRDPKWLCLCTTEVKRVHRSCAISRGRQGQRNKACQQCAIENQFETLEPARQRARVIIIGAGPAGLAAAKQLRGCGIDPLVIEARSRLGGRIQTVRIGESNVDLGAAYIHGCDELYNPVFLKARNLSPVHTGTSLDFVS